MEPITAAFAAVLVALITAGPTWIAARRGKKAAETASARAEVASVRAEESTAAAMSSKDEIMLSLLGLHNKIDGTESRTASLERDIDSIRSQVSQMNLMVLRNRNDIRRLESRS